MDHIRDVAETFCLLVGGVFGLMTIGVIFFLIFALLISWIRDRKPRKYRSGSIVSQKQREVLTGPGSRKIYYGSLDFCDEITLYHNEQDGNGQAAQRH